MIQWFQCFVALIWTNIRTRTFYFTLTFLSACLFQTLPLSSKWFGSFFQRCCAMCILEAPSFGNWGKNCNVICRNVSNIKLWRGAKVLRVWTCKYVDTKDYKSTKCEWTAWPSTHFPNCSRNLLGQKNNAAIAIPDGKSKLMHLSERINKHNTFF